MNALDKFLGKHAAKLGHLDTAHSKAQAYGPNKGKKIENRLKAKKTIDVSENLVCDSYMEDCY